MTMTHLEKLEARLGDPADPRVRAQRTRKAPMTTEYRYVVKVWTDTQDQADQVMTERIGPDEDYGFDYTIEFEPESGANVA